MELPFRKPRTLGVPARAFDVLLGLALGAALVYFLDRALPRAHAGGLDQPTDDRLLRERVRNALAQTIADPDAVDLRVHGGTVILRGPATGEQIAEMVACASRVRGVRFVDNRLSPIA
jgi:osmotically-inducible protein OsmY